MRPGHFFLRREGLLAIGHLYRISASYAVNDIGGGARKVISNLNGSLGFRHFLYVMNERTRSLASDQKVCYAFVTFE